MTYLRHAFLCAALAATTACVVDEGADTADTANVATQQPLPAPPMPPDTAGRPQPSRELQIEVDLAARKLNVMRGSERVNQYDVAVGSSEWPTQKGEWTISQVVWNPEWVPPQEEWAKDEEPKQPGAADNPLGRVQLVYDPPRTIHGTNEPSSIGKAVSHGSIRMRNADAAALARRVMEAGGASRDSSFFDRVRSNRSEKVIVDLPAPVPIRVQ